MDRTLIGVIGVVVTHLLLIFYIYQQSHSWSEIVRGLDVAHASYNARVWSRALFWQQFLKLPHTHTPFSFQFTLVSLMLRVLHSLQTGPLVAHTVTKKRGVTSMQLSKRDSAIWHILTGSSDTSCGSSMKAVKCSLSCPEVSAHSLSTDASAFLQALEQKHKDMLRQCGCFFLYIPSLSSHTAWLLTYQMFDHEAEYVGALCSERRKCISAGC